MKVIFYGTRGSAPVPEKDFIQVGGNTSSILVTLNNGDFIILDAGTGIRKLGSDLSSRSFQPEDDIHVLLSHTHWDHIQGFPFFNLAYDSSRHVTIAICGNGVQEAALKRIFKAQMRHEYFPVRLEKMGAAMSFSTPDSNGYTTPKGVRIKATKLNHPGDAFGYRIEEEGKSLVYCTDVEHANGLDPKVVALTRDADLLIHDAQFTPDELKKKKGWGHSSWEQALEVAEKAGAKRLALFHHDPVHTDNFLLGVERACRSRFPSAFLAKEGMEIDL